MLLTATFLHIFLLNVCFCSPLLLETDVYDEIAPQFVDDADDQSGDDDYYQEAYNDEFLTDTYDDTDSYDDTDNYDDLVTVGEDELAADRIMEDFQDQQDQVTLHR